MFCKNPSGEVRPSVGEYLDRKRESHRSKVFKKGREAPVDGKVLGMRE